MTVAIVREEGGYVWAGVIPAGAIGESEFWLLNVLKMFFCETVW